MIDYSKPIYVTLIDIHKNKYKNYKKTFNDERHFDNWVSMMERNNMKYIGAIQ